MALSFRRNINWRQGRSFLFGRARRRRHETEDNISHHRANRSADDDCCRRAEVIGQVTDLQVSER